MQFCKITKPKEKQMTFLSRLVDKIKGIFAPKTAAVAEPASGTVVSPEPIQPIVVTAAGNLVPPAAGKQEPVVEAAPAAPVEAPLLAQPAPVADKQEPVVEAAPVAPVEAPLLTVVEIKTEPKTEAKPKKPRAKKEAAKEKPAREEKPKKEKKPGKRALPKAK